MALAVQGQDDPEPEKEPLFMRMTPMEMDVHLQAAELIFHSLLRGQRLGVDYGDIEEWYLRTFGEGWVERNNLQRKEILQQMKDEGENTPEWMEALSHMGDIAWEMFCAGSQGELVRERKDIDRREVIEQFKELLPKVRESYYARCGSGDRLYGLRACIAVLMVFAKDTEVLDHMLTALLYIIADNEYGNNYNRDGICELFVPAPPQERLPKTKETGWSFLLSAFDALLIQAGGGAEAPYVDEDELAERNDHSSKEVAAKIARCIFAVREAPAFRAQMALLREDPQGRARPEREQVKAMIPAVCERLQELCADPALRDESLEKLLSMLTDTQHGGAMGESGTSASGAGSSWKLLGSSASS